MHARYIVALGQLKYIPSILGDAIHSFLKKNVILI